MPENTMKIASSTKSIKGPAPLSHSATTFDPYATGYALIKGLDYLKNRLAWSGTKIAHILHLPANTLNTWIKKGFVPISNNHLQPDVQAIIHLLAIHRSLEAMFENPAHQQAWISTHHPVLNDIPENLMAESIEKLIFVRQYLDYKRGKGA